MSNLVLVDPTRSCKTSGFTVAKDFTSAPVPKYLPAMFYTLTNNEKVSSAIEVAIYNLIRPSYIA